MTHTRMVRISADLAEKIAAVVRHYRTGSTSDLVDPVLRPRIEEMFLALPDTDRRYAEERIARMTSSTHTA